MSRERCTNGNLCREYRKSFRHRVGLAASRKRLFRSTEMGFGDLCVYTWLWACMRAHVHQCVFSARVCVCVCVPLVCHDCTQPCPLAPHKPLAPPHPHHPHLSSLPQWYPSMQQLSTWQTLRASFTDWLPRAFRKWLSNHWALWHRRSGQFKHRVHITLWTPKLLIT